MSPGLLIRYREREWIVHPSDDPNLIFLRPIGGSSREVCGVIKSLVDPMAYGEMPHKRIETTQFPLMSLKDVQRHVVEGQNPPLLIVCILVSMNALMRKEMG